MVDEDGPEAIDDPDGAIYERAVYIIPYKQGKFMAKIHRTIEEINLEGLDIPDKNVRMLNTKEFSEEERENRLLDFVGGFELMDNEIRMLVVEGVGGKGRSMNKFYRANER